MLDILILENKHFENSISGKQAFQKKKFNNVHLEPSY